MPHVAAPDKLPYVLCTVAVVDAAELPMVRFPLGVTGPRLKPIVVLAAIGLL